MRPGPLAWSVLLSTGPLVAAPSPAEPSKAPQHGPTRKATAHTPAKHVATIAGNRLGNDFTIRVRDRHGRLPAAANKQFEEVMRAGTASHAIDPRLLPLVVRVVEHFGGKKIEIVSGYRPFTKTQHTPHSNHNHGKAIDFRVVGVKNYKLYEFCRTLGNVGCGYYPNSTFVHMDVREKPATWTDYSGPGEAPDYEGPNKAPPEHTEPADGTNEEIPPEPLP